MKDMEISQIEDNNEEDEVNSKSSRPPHEALFLLLLAYLPVYELVAMSEVCKSLKDAVNKDVLPWLNIIIVDRPLSFKLSDEMLIKIASKANGRLATLSLVNCTRITDNGLQQVIHKNPLITKLYMPGCTGMTPEGVITAVKTLSQQHPIQSLKINGIYNITKQHINTIHAYLQIKATHQKQQQPRPVLYHVYRNRNCSAYEETNRVIDVEICPRCNEVGMVFECPRKSCNCMRGCSFCIPRCEECGGCVEPEEELQDTLCSDTLCSYCWLQLPKCNLCNRPYCTQHGNQQSSSSDSGFVCDACEAKFITSSYEDDE